MKRTNCHKIYSSDAVVTTAVMGHAPDIGDEVIRRVPEHVPDEELADWLDGIEQMSPPPATHRLGNMQYLCFQVLRYMAYIHISVSASSKQLTRHVHIVP